MNSDFGPMRGKNSRKKKINRRKKSRGKKNNRGGTRRAATKTNANRKTISMVFLGILWLPT